MSDFLDKLVIWQPTGAASRADDELYAPHYGVLEIGDLALRCYQLSDGQRVIDAQDMAGFFEVLAGLQGSPAYDPAFGDERLCGCGHSYYRHFDTYEQMAPVGCKYCPCREFVLSSEEP